MEQRTNLDVLQESIITQAELMELKGDPVGLVEGHVIESKTDVSRGYAHCQDVLAKLSEQTI